MEGIVPKQKCLPLWEQWEDEQVWLRLPEESRRELVVLYARLTVRAAQEEKTIDQGVNNEQ